MRSLVSRLRTDSLKMLKSLSGLTERNAVLERECSEARVYRKGLVIEVEELRREVGEGQRVLEGVRRENAALRGRVEGGDLGVGEAVE
jgi:hypothetical protein